jgi:hypothetical protein
LRIVFAVLWVLSCCLAQVEALAREMEWGLELVEAVEGSEGGAECMSGKFTGCEWLQLQIDTDDSVSQLAGL